MADPRLNRCPKSTSGDSTKNQPVSTLVYWTLKGDNTQMARVFLLLAFFGIIG